MQALRFHLSALVHPDVLKQTVITIDDGERFTPDATIYADRSRESALPVCAFIEVKNKVGTGDCNPTLQCQSDFTKLFCKCCRFSANSRSLRYGRILDASYRPVFLLAIAAPRLLVLAPSSRTHSSLKN